MVLLCPMMSGAARPRTRHHGCYPLYVSPMIAVVPGTPAWQEQEHAHRDEHQQGGRHQGGELAARRRGQPRHLRPPRPRRGGGAGALLGQARGGGAALQQSGARWGYISLNSGICDLGR